MTDTDWGIFIVYLHSRCLAIIQVNSPVETPLWQLLQLEKGGTLGQPCNIPKIESPVKLERLVGVIHFPEYSTLLGSEHFTQAKLLLGAEQDRQS